MICDQQFPQQTALGQDTIEHLTPPTVPSAVCAGIVESIFCSYKCSMQPWHSSYQFLGTEKVCKCWIFSPYWIGWSPKNTSLQVVTIAFLIKKILYFLNYSLQHICASTLHMIHLVTEEHCNPVSCSFNWSERVHNDSWYEILHLHIEIRNKFNCVTLSQLWEGV